MKLSFPTGSISVRYASEALLALKRIELIGFKSFADKTVLKFLKGITAIVGPNGCGKSNVADAFRWVLGEQSAKSMRGSKMFDVIFSGSSKRKPLNFAEVSITFSNEEGILPIQFEEVTVTRRLYRSGDSEYFINRHPARLKDILNLLMDSGVGRDAFAIFEQGKIDQVIQLSPTERRTIFEAAAGVTRFLLEKKGAMKKLEKVEQNTARVADINREVEKQVNLYEKQAVQAKKYMELKRLIQELDQKILLAKWESIGKKIQENVSQKSELDKKYLKAQQDNDSLKNTVLQHKEKAKELEEQREKQREILFQARNEKEISHKEQENVQLRLQEERRNEKKLLQEKEELRERSLGYQQEMTELRTKVKLTEETLKKFEVDVLSQRQNTEELERDVSLLREQQAQLHNHKLNITQALSKAETRWHQTKVRSEHVQENIRKSQEKAQLYQNQLKELEGSIQKITFEVELYKQQSEEKNSFLKELETNFSELKEILKNLENERETLRHKLAEQKARLNVLKQLREAMQGFSKGTKTLLNESQNPKSALYKTLTPLYELIEIAEGDDKSAVAVRAYNQTLAVKNREHQQLVVRWAQEQQIRDYSIVCLEEIDVDSLTHFTRALKEVDTLENVISKELHNMTTEIWVCQEKALIDRSGVIFFPVFGENNVFTREAELKSLQEQIIVSENHQRKLEENYQSNLKKKQTMQLEKETCEKDLRQLEIKIRERTIQLEQQNSDLKKITLEQEQLEKDSKEFLDLLNTYEEELKQAATELEENKRKLHEANENALKEKRNLESSQDNLNTQKNQLRIIEKQLQEKLDELQKISHQINLIKLRDEERILQEKKIDDSLRNSQESQKNLQVRLENYETTVSSNLQKVEQLDNQLKHYEAATTQSKKEIEVLEKQGETNRENLHSIEQKKYQCSLQGEQLLQEQKKLEQDLFEGYQLTVQEAQGMSLALEDEISSAEKKHHSLKRQFEGMGNVNMTAIDECALLKERYDYLNQQLADLAASKEELIRIIAELDGQSRKLFQETFDAISENFKKNFSILFRGGEADLKFTDSTDVLEAGVEIIAKPPGKQMRSISLMSGGEKCLTALALLFAIFEVKPAPFCILDEIDAPLDDSNISRFVNVVQQFIDRCQFIIITHNKRTMAIADCIYGVSMEERGVSRLLSMEFEREQVVQPV
ncbi:MAG: chromosome segregation protein SMC [Chlamydiales bacterium]